MLRLLLEGAPSVQPTFPWGWMIGIMAIVYFLILRPQAKEQRNRRDMLAALKKNDKVLTRGGMYGQVVSLDDNDVTLKVDDNVRIRFSRGAIERVIVPESDKDDA